MISPSPHFSSLSGWLFPLTIAAQISDGELVCTKTIDRSKVDGTTTLFAGEVHIPSLELGSTPKPLLRSPRVQDRKSPAVAAGLELLLPVLGNGYAGNAKRGIVSAILRVGGVLTGVRPRTIQALTIRQGSHLEPGK